MSCYFAPHLRRMARNIRLSQMRAQPVPDLPEYPPVHFLFIFSPIIAHFSRKSFQLLFPALDKPSSSYKTSASQPPCSPRLSLSAGTILQSRY